MSTSARVLAFAALSGLMGAGLGLWGGSVQSPALAAEMSARAEGVKIACVDVLDVAEKLFQSDRYAPVREKALKEKEGQRDALQAGLTELQQRIIAAGQDSAEGRTMLPTYQAKAQELQQFVQAADTDLDRLSTGQFNECYRLAAETAQSIAKQQGYTHLLASKMGSLEFRSTQLQPALQEVLARPVLMTPAGDDLTAQVKKELKIEEKPAEAKPDAKPDASKSTPPAKK